MPRQTLSCAALLLALLNGCAVTFTDLPASPPPSADPALGSLALRSLGQVLVQGFDGSWSRVGDSASSLSAAAAIEGTGVFTPVTVDGAAAADYEGTLEVSQHWGTSPAGLTTLLYLFPISFDSRIVVDLSVSDRHGRRAACARNVEYRVWKQTLLVPLAAGFSALGYERIATNRLIADCAHEVKRTLPLAQVPAVDPDAVVPLPEPTLPVRP